MSPNISVSIDENNRNVLSYDESDCTLERSRGLDFLDGTGEKRGRRPASISRMILLFLKKSGLAADITNVTTHMMSGSESITITFVIDGEALDRYGYRSNR